jgi:hypothetical protein
MQGLSNRIGDLAFAFYRESQTITRAGKNGAARGLHQTSIESDRIAKIAL